MMYIWLLLKERLLTVSMYGVYFITIQGDTNDFSSEHPSLNAWWVIDTLPPFFGMLYTGAASLSPLKLL